jgi:hypothetical protein
VVDEVARRTSLVARGDTREYCIITKEKEKKEFKRKKSGEKESKEVFI